MAALSAVSSASSVRPASSPEELNSIFRRIKVVSQQSLGGLQSFFSRGSRGGFSQADFWSTFVSKHKALQSLAGDMKNHAAFTKYAKVREAMMCHRGIKGKLETLYREVGATEKKDQEDIERVVKAYANAAHLVEYAGAYELDLRFEKGTADCKKLPELYTFVHRHLKSDEFNASGSRLQIAPSGLAKLTDVIISERKRVEVVNKWVADRFEGTELTPFSFELVGLGQYELGYVGPVRFKLHQGWALLLAASHCGCKSEIDLEKTTRKKPDNKKENLDWSKQELTLAALPIEQRRREGISIIGNVASIEKFHEMLAQHTLLKEQLRELCTTLAPRTSYGEEVQVEVGLKNTPLVLNKSLLDPGNSKFVPLERQYIAGVDRSAMSDFIQEVRWAFTDESGRFELKAQQNEDGSIKCLQVPLFNDSASIYLPPSEQVDCNRMKELLEQIFAGANFVPLSRSASEAQSQAPRKKTFGDLKKLGLEGNTINLNDNEVAKLIEHTRIEAKARSCCLDQSVAYQAKVVEAYKEGGVCRQLAELFGEETPYQLAFRFISQHAGVQGYSQPNRERLASLMTTQFLEVMNLHRKNCLFGDAARYVVCPKVRSWINSNNQLIPGLKTSVTAAVMAYLPKYFNWLITREGGEFSLLGLKKEVFPILGDMPLAQKERFFHDLACSIESSYFDVNQLIASYSHNDRTNALLRIFYETKGKFPLEFEVEQADLERIKDYFNASELLPLYVAGGGDQQEIVRLRETANLDSLLNSPSLRWLNVFRDAFNDQNYRREFLNSAFSYTARTQDLRSEVEGCALLSECEAVLVKHYLERIRRDFIMGSKHLFSSLPEAGTVDSFLKQYGDFDTKQVREDLAASPFSPLAGKMFQKKSFKAAELLLDRSEKAFKATALYRETEPVQESFRVMIEVLRGKLEAFKDKDVSTVAHYAEYASWKAFTDVINEFSQISYLLKDLSPEKREVFINIFGGAKDDWYGCNAGFLGKFKDILAVLTASSHERSVYAFDGRTRLAPSEIAMSMRQNLTEHLPANSFLRGRESSWLAEALSRKMNNALRTGFKNFWLETSAKTSYANETESARLMQAHYSDEYSKFLQANPNGALYTYLSSLVFACEKLERAHEGLQFNELFHALGMNPESFSDPMSSTGYDKQKIEEFLPRAVLRQLIDDNVLTSKVKYEEDMLEAASTYRAFHPFNSKFRLPTTPESSDLQPLPKESVLSFGRALNVVSKSTIRFLEKGDEREDVEMKTSSV